VAEKTVKRLLCCGFWRTCIKRWDNWINVGGGHVEKWMISPQVRISHVLRFIINCDLFTDSSSYILKSCNTVDVQVNFQSLMTSLKPLCSCTVHVDTRQLLSTCSGAG
jgi:hypothetical protein